MVLVEGSRVRFGLTAYFRISGLLPEQGIAGETVVVSLLKRLKYDYAQFEGLDGREKNDALAALQGFTVRIAMAPDFEMLAGLAADNRAKLSKTVFGNAASEGIGAFNQALPPIDDDLPDPDAPHPISIQGTLLPGMLDPTPGSEEEDNPDV